MKTTYVIETVDELLQVVAPVRCAGDNSPSLPQDATLIVENDFANIRLQAEGFTLSSDVKPEAIFKRALESLGFRKIHFT